MNMYFDNDIFLITDFPVALDSPDHTDPYGTIQDFTDGKPFAEHLTKHFPEKRRLIDLGTATGTVPMTMRELGMLSIGLEGSDTPKIQKLGAWGEMPDIVRTCDISRPFHIIGEKGNLIKFDFITSWDVIEHIHPDRLNILFENIKSLMNKKSIGIFNINLTTSIHHQSGSMTKEEWTNIILDYFDMIPGFTFDKSGAYQKHPYCRPINEELEREELGHYRTFWWVRLKKRDL